jgi:hypothetical protein
MGPLIMLHACSLSQIRQAAPKNVMLVHGEAIKVRKQFPWRCSRPLGIQPH